MYIPYKGKNHNPSKLNRESILNSASNKSYLIRRLLRKEVIQPQVLLRLPCYDFTPIIDPTFGRWLLKHKVLGYLTDFGCYQLSWCDGRCVQGPGTYSPRHADSRLLATPASCRRVAAYNPNWDEFLSLAPPCGLASLCTHHCSTCVALDIRGMMI